VFRLLRRLILVSLVVVAALFAAGLVAFALTIPRASERPASLDVDAVVVLTGGSNRVEDALRLFDAGVGRRLLVSGANPRTTQAEVIALLGPPSQRLRCCVDMGRAAEDTIGNAEETRDWADRHGFRSLAVVTSGYHVPRAMAEMRHLLPRVRLVAYPVASAHLASEDPFADPATFQVVAAEYVKHVVGVLRRGAF
jgi:uncharacterized SAM-binding protein YcdF (DUF218 family)